MCLYLPLYNGVKYLRLGVPKGSELTLVKETDTKPIVIWGTSILQGAVASRPGMAYANMLRRWLDNTPLVDLGFSGNGKMQSSVVPFISQSK
jgi:GDSL-like Lipase/Acylhydrolase family